jgi:hypothetical protein
VPFRVRLIYLNRHFDAFGDLDPEVGSAGLGTVHLDFTLVLVHDLLYHRQTQTGAILFAGG